MDYKKLLTDCKYIYLKHFLSSFRASIRERSYLIRHTRRDYNAFFEEYLENTKGGFFVITNENRHIACEVIWVKTPSVFVVNSTLVMPWFGFSHRTQLLKAMSVIEQEVLMKERVTL